MALSQQHYIILVPFPCKFKFNFFEYNHCEKEGDVLCHELFILNNILFIVWKTRWLVFFTIRSFQCEHILWSMCRLRAKSLKTQNICVCTENRTRVARPVYDNAFLSFWKIHSLVFWSQHICSSMHQPCEQPCVTHLKLIRINICSIVCKCSSRTRAEPIYQLQSSAPLYIWTKRRTCRCLVVSHMSL